MSKISVIIPIYKVEKYLARCLDSLLCQTFTDFELVLVDDCSPDNCLDICSEYAKKDSRIKVFHLDKNVGLSAARNVGLKNCCGEYVAFVDSDDYVSPNYLQDMLELIEKENADIVQFDFYDVVDDKVVEKRGVVDKAKTYTKKEIFDFLYGTVDAYTVNFMVWNKLYKADTIKGLRFEEGLKNEDVIFTSGAIMRADKIAVRTRSTYYYCKRSDSIMAEMKKDKNALIYSHLLAYRKIAEYAENEIDYVRDLVFARLANYYVSAIKNKMLKDKTLKSMLKEDKKRFRFRKNKKIPFVKRVVLSLWG